MVHGNLHWAQVQRSIGAGADLFRLADRVHERGPGEVNDLYCTTTYTALRPVFSCTSPIFVPRAKNNTSIMASGRCGRKDE